MDPDEYHKLVKFLTEEAYPEEAMTHRLKWNYKRKSSSYFVGEKSKLYKVGNPAFLGI